MLLRGWAIDRFGHLRSSAGAGIGDHLTVIWAPNETGKSTLHHFIRWTLLGYPGNTLPMRRYRGAPHSGAIGGRLLVEHRGQSLVLARDSKTKVSRITTSSGAESGFSQADLTGTITLPAYEAVFGIGVDDLQSADALGQDNVREQIFAAGTVGGGRSAAEALKDIEARLKHLTRRSTGFIATARRDLDAAVADLATVRHHSEHLPALQSELDRLEAEGRAATEELSELDRQRDRLARLRRVWPTWSPAMAAERDLAELAELDLGLDPLGHLENELDRRQSLQSLVGATRTQLSRLTQESERLVNDPALCAVLPQAEAALASSGRRSPATRGPPGALRLRGPAPTTSRRATVPARSGLDRGVGGRGGHLVPGAPASGGRHQMRSSAPPPDSTRCGSGPHSAPTRSNRPIVDFWTSTSRRLLRRGPLGAGSGYRSRFRG